MPLGVVPREARENRSERTRCDAGELPRAQMEVAKVCDKRLSENNLSPRFDATRSRSPWC
jgi:hypothetical protein